jgi:Mg2+/Co2+ transporter CorB
MAMVHNPRRRPLRRPDPYPPLDAIPQSILLAALAVLLILSAFFSSSETALMSLNRYRLRHMAKEGHRGARLAQKLLERPDRLIGLILLGNNFVNILASAVTTVAFVQIAGEAGILIGTVFLTAVVLIFAEVAPKTVAAYHPERLAYAASYVLYPLLKVAYPLVRVINAMAGGLLWLLRVPLGTHRGDELTPEELRTLLGETGNVLRPKHQRMLLNILELEEATVDDVMVPRNEIEGIDLDEPMDSVLERIARFPYSRIPLYHDTIDRVVGILHPRKLLGAIGRQPLTPELLVRESRKPYFIPEGTPLIRQLGEFQRRERRMGLVVDEYGDIIGLVTIEDILEEIVGEFTTEPLASARRVERLPDGTVRADGRVSLRSLNRLMDWDLPTESARTLSGLIIEQLEGIPAEGAEIRIDGLHMRMERVEDNVIRSVIIREAPAGDTAEV